MPAPEPQHLDIRFTGSGSEYFRIWIVNLLLSVVTLSLYLPFAKARRLAYFQGNTVVGGHALGFHGDPWKMFRGYLLVLALGITYSVGSRMSPVAAIVALAAMVMVWPALWRAAMQFRAANTSWRGVRMRFLGSLGGAYGAMLPAFLPAVFIVLASLTLGEARHPGQPGPPGAAEQAMAMAIGLIMLASMALGPWFMARIKRYQHNHYGYAAEQTRLGASTIHFYGLALKMAGVGLLVTALALIIGFAVVAVGGGLALIAAVFSKGGPGEAGPGGMFAFVMVIVAVGLFYLTLFSVSGPYLTSRTQNLVWGTTASAHLQFRSDLRFWPLLKVTLINLVLTVLTLGLYRPFAAVATARLRLQALSLVVSDDVNQWVQADASSMNDATGDLAGDFFGFDVGL
jgi:uncharacterized membrane protein YjgN (DUF898 family)